MYKLNCETPNKDPHCEQVGPHGPLSLSRQSERDTMQQSYPAEFTQSEFDTMEKVCKGPMQLPDYSIVLESFPDVSSFLSFALESLYKISAHTPIQAIDPQGLILSVIFFKRCKLCCNLAFLLIPLYLSQPSKP